MKCVCGGEPTKDGLNGVVQCYKCSRYFHGLETTPDGEVSLWSKQAPDRLRPTGAPFIYAGIGLGIAAVLTYIYAQQLPATVAGPLDTVEKLDNLPAPIAVNELRIVLSSLSLVAISMGPVLWLTGQIIKAISWLPSRTPVLERSLEEINPQPNPPVETVIDHDR